jgi:acyl-CoA synthetase (AMP-forming)/AMP-acid ligase II
VLKKEERLADEELRRMLSRRLPPYKIPKFVEFRESLPKNQSGKILKAKLREGG